MRCKNSLSFRLITAFIMAAGGTANVSAQGTAAEGGSSAIWFYLFIILLFGIIGTGFIFWRRGQNTKFQARYNYADQSKAYNSTNGTYDMDSVDALVELEWLRKAKKATSKGSQPMPAV